MTKKIPVFVVIGANYDDYHLVGCFSSRREAEIHIEWCEKQVTTVKKRWGMRDDYEIHEEYMTLEETI